MPKLSYQEEERLLNEYAIKLGNNEITFESIMDFARLYHAEATKTALSGEVKSPDYFLKKHTNLSEWLFQEAKDALFDAFKDYADQFFLSMPAHPHQKQE